MKWGLVGLIVVCVAACHRPAPPRRSADYVIVELPRPNSETYTYDEAAARQPELYTLWPTPMLTDWRSSWGTSFGIHITARDELMVYGSSFVSEGVPTHVSEARLKRLLETREDFRGSEPIHVLITCEDDSATSARLRQVAQLAFMPSVQVHYVCRAK